MVVLLIYDLLGCCMHFNFKPVPIPPLVKGHPDQRPLPLERPLDNVNLNVNVWIYTPDERPPLMKGHFSGAKGVAPQEWFH